MHYKDLIVWQKSMVIVTEVYELTSQLPHSEIYGLVSQMRRSAVSIPSNIAEGNARNSKKEFLNFLSIAYGSSAELETQLLLVGRLYRNINTNKTNQLLIEVQKILRVLIRKLH